MSNPAELVYVLAFVLVPAAYLVSMILGDVLVWRLRKRHPETWEALGCPLYVGAMRRPNATFAFLRFLWRREYRGLPDERTIRLAAFVRIFFFASFVVCVVVGGLFTATFVWFMQQALDKLRG